MSKLDEMIRELCPDGVEYVKLNSVCDIYDGTHSTPNYTESGVKFASVENIGNLYARLLTEMKHSRFMCRWHC